MPQKNQQVSVAPQATLMEGLKQAGLPVASSCRGEGVCTKCRVQIIAGAENLSPPTDLELLAYETELLPAVWRLSCQCRVLGDVTVKTSYW